MPSPHHPAATVSAERAFTSRAEHATFFEHFGPTGAPDIQGGTVMFDHNGAMAISRRKLLAGGSVSAATLALRLRAATPPRSSSMTVIDTLAEGNETFSRTRYSSNLKIIPSLRLLIIGCVDPRVDPEEIFSLKQGEAAVIRNVGGRVFPSTLQTLDMLVEVGRAKGNALGEGWSLVVLHHTDCGIRALAHSPELAQHFGKAPSDLPSMAVTDPYTSVAMDVAALKAHPLIAGAAISGLVYDVGTGRTKTVVAPD